MMKMEIPEKPVNVHLMHAEVFVPDREGVDNHSYGPVLQYGPCYLLNNARPYVARLEDTRALLGAPVDEEVPVGEHALAVRNRDGGFVLRRKGRDILVPGYETVFSHADTEKLRELVSRYCGE
jgi:hypothetical protein